MRRFALQKGYCMKSSIFVVMATFATFACVEDVTAPSAEQARDTYEKALQVANDERVATLQSAKDASLKEFQVAKDASLNELQTALDNALNSKDLKEANKIAEAIKFMTKTSVLGATTSPVFDNAKRTYEETTRAANEKYQFQVLPARAAYLTALEAAVDVALVAKDLEEANRIDAVIQRLRVEPGTWQNSVWMTFRLLPAGTFIEGSPESDRKPVSDETEHEVILTQPFSIGIYEVTQSQYVQLMGSNPSDFKSANNPVENVSWDDAMTFCKNLSALPAEQEAGRVYRLPTEAEWEYACRADTTTDYSFGDLSPFLIDSGWFGLNSRHTTHDVGEKLPNSWGLFDMHDNVWEWCTDWNGDYPRGVATDPLGPDEGTLRVLRGGGWNSTSEWCQSACR